MKLYVGFLLLGGILYATGQDTTECVQSNKCSCSKTFTRFIQHPEEFNYQCSTNNVTIGLIIVPGEEIEIHCPEEITEYPNLDMFPNINIGDIERFAVTRCPLPKNGFNSTLTKFQIKNLKSLKLDTVSLTGSETITKELFDGFSEIESLSLTSLKIKLDEDFLDYFPNLKTLNLGNNSIRDIKSGMFKYLPKLEMLVLSQNEISNLPDGVFSNLSNLQHLHLERNKLTALNKHSFAGLRQVKSLYLATNKIASIDEDVFADLTELIYIDLWSNNLHLIPSNIFQHNTALASVHMGNNPNLNLSECPFANLTKLVNLELNNCNLRNLPENSFKGSVNLYQIFLINNNIADLPEYIFENLTEIDSIYLERNKIKSLPNNIFSSSSKMQILDLSGNEIEEINENVFRQTHRLRILKLGDNRIRNISFNAFAGLKQLVNLNLSHNLLDLDYGEEELSPFRFCQELDILLLSHNAIKKFPKNIINNLKNLAALDLNYNNIQHIKMDSLIKKSPYALRIEVQNNNISVVDFKGLAEYVESNVSNHNTSENKPPAVLYLSHNPIKCDCSNYDLVQYINDKLNPLTKTLVDVRVESLSCSTPESFKDTLVETLKPEQVTCPLMGVECPKECTCEHRPYDDYVLVNCSYRNLTNLPHLNLKGIHKVEVNLEGNLLESAPHKELGYDSVTRLNLSNNRIRSISWIPLQIEVLNLSENRLKYIDPEIVDGWDLSTTLKQIVLAGNPWQCGCSATALQNYLRSNNSKINPTDIKCEDNNQPLVSRGDVCKSQ